MLVLHLRPLDPDRRQAEAARLAEVLDRGSDKVQGLSHAGLRGTGDRGRVECAGTDPVALIGVLLSVVRSGRWAGLLVAAAGDPPAEEEVERHLARAAASTGRCALVVVAPPTPPRRRGTAVSGGDASRGALVESSLQLLGALERRRSEPQQAAGRLVEAGASQREAAAELGITQQAVHDRLRTGLWHETRTVAAALAAAVGELGR